MAFYSAIICWLIFDELFVLAMLLRSRGAAGGSVTVTRTNRPLTIASQPLLIMNLISKPARGDRRTARPGSAPPRPRRQWELR
jgi:hypothetical protein